MHGGSYSGWDIEQDLPENEISTRKHHELSYRKSKPMIQSQTHQSTHIIYAKPHAALLALKTYPLASILPFSTFTLKNSGTAAQIIKTRKKKA